MNGMAEARTHWRWDTGTGLVTSIVAIAYLTLFGQAIVTLGTDWWTNGEYGHGFLLLPIILWLAWKSRLGGSSFSVSGRDRALALVGLSTSIGLYLVGVLAGEWFVQRLGFIIALGSLTVYYRGWAQLKAWWLPFALLLSTIPLPDVVLDGLTKPLQLLASRVAVWLLNARHVPAAQAGNVIFLPGQELFVAMACSGLRSISALLGITLLIGGTMLTSVWGRSSLLLLAIPIAIAANIFRVFATGFGAYYVGPQVAQNISHSPLAIAVYVLPLCVVGVAALLIRRIER